MNWYRISCRPRRRLGAVACFCGIQGVVRAICLFLLVVASGVLCPVSQAQNNEWAWMGGTDANNKAGVYGTLQVPAAGNIPGGRSNAVTWTDSNSNLWLFGGFGYDGAGNFGALNDLWEFNPATSQWTWMGGSNSTYSTPGGVYGTLGTPAAANIPGARDSAVGWTDGKGNFWLFGGKGEDSTDTYGYLNDLWEFSPATSEWTWMGGSSTVPGADEGNPSVYGTLGVAAAGNIPGGRYGAVSWIDRSGNFWLFGGDGSSSANDLWEFNPSANEWTWVSGSSTLTCAPGTKVCASPGIYGTLLIPAATNVPGGRSYSVSWLGKDASLWLLGGYGVDSGGNPGYLNDLWRFNPATSQWTWMSGSHTVSAIYGGPAGVYGTWMTPAAGNTPGGRQSSVGWIDTNGNFWLFGGYGVDSANYIGFENDLWVFQPSTNEWAWMGGNTVNNQPGSRDTLGTPSFANTPAARGYSVSWSDLNGNFWLFGGLDREASGITGDLDGLWEFQPNTGSLPAAAVPTFSPSDARTFTVEPSVTISDATAGASIYYLINNSVPPVLYTTPIPIPVTETIQAFAVAGGYSISPVGTATYSLNLPPVATPVFSLTAGVYSSQQTLTISDATPNSTIYYTNDRSTPTSASTMYSGPITISSSETIQAFAAANGDANSPIATAAYTIWPPSAVGGWAWMAGTNGAREYGVWGTLGTPSLANFPGSRSNAVSWTDSSGNLWLFGGTGVDSAQNFALLNDLWEFNPLTLEWSWVSGSSFAGPSSECHFSDCGQLGVYGTLGTAAGNNFPGSRQDASGSTDKNGDFWLFGGNGYASTATPVASGLNDIWKFQPSTMEWTWMGGSDDASGTCFNYALSEYCTGQLGVYGTLGIPGAGNTPGGRQGSTTWIDSNGNLWMFGGVNVDENLLAQYYFNDFWEFNPSIKQWAWMGGSNTDANSYCYFDPNSFLSDCGQSGVYGTLGAASSTNSPGSRSGAAGWVDSGGNLWMFGGLGFDIGGGYSDLNDLWEFQPSTKQWTWVGGSSAIQSVDYGQPSVYGVLGVPAAGNIAGGRAAAASWTDNKGNFWLFGGQDGAYLRTSGSLWNDLWEFTPGANEWAWMGGSTSNLFALAGVYGTEGVPDVANLPPSRSGESTWTDKAGNLWLFGGYNPSHGFFNDLWEYQPSAPAPVPSFALSAATNSINISQGLSNGTTISTLAAGGFNSSIALTANGQPSGVTVSFSPGSITGASSSTMNIAVASSVALGAYQITVTGTSGNITATATLGLTVLAPPPTFTLSASPASLDVTGGNKGTVTLTVTPQNGFNAAVGFACSGLPAGALCSFSPNTVTPSGAAASTTLTLTTSATGALKQSTRPLFPAIVFSLAICCFKGRRRRRRLTLLLLVCSIAGLNFLSGCGSGTSSSSPPDPTATTSTITVTATSASLQQTTTFSLTVN